MRKILAYVVIFILLFSFVAADLCKESDDGRDYEESGYVKYGVIKYEDLCVLRPDADMRLPEGQYLKEYYCKDDNKKHEIIDCFREGFDKCEKGRCVKESSSDTQVSQPKAPVYVAPVCGNKIVDSGEECDPPTKICFKGSNVGLCSSNCACEIKIRSDDTDTTDTSDTAQDDTTDTVDDSSDSATDTSKIDTPKTTNTVDSKTDDKTQDKDGISTEQNRLALPKEPKKGLFGRILGWFAGWFD